MRNRSICLAGSLLAGFFIMLPVMLSGLRATPALAQDGGETSVEQQMTIAALQLDNIYLQATITALQAQQGATPIAVPTLIPPTFTPIAPTFTPIPTGIPLEQPPLTTGTANYMLSLNGDSLNVSLFDLEGRVGNIDMVAQNPANPNQFAVVNGAGQMFFVSDYANRIIERVPLPFLTEYHWQVSRREDNNAAITQIAWSNDGALAFIVDGDDSKDTPQDGVWTWIPNGGLFHLMSNCTSTTSCVLAVNRTLSSWRAVGLSWSPDNTHLLVRLELPDEGKRRAFVIADRQTTVPDTLPPLFNYEYANWTADGQQVVVSGATQDGRVIVGVLNRDGSSVSLIDSTQIGVVWAQDAVEYGGQVYFLGSAVERGGGLSLYAWTGRRLTEDFGVGAPDTIAWSPDHRAVLVVVDESSGWRGFVARADTSGVTEISGQIANLRSIAWVGVVQNIVTAQQQAITTPVNVTPRPFVAAPAQNALLTGALPGGTPLRVLTALALHSQPVSRGDNVTAQLATGDALTAIAGPIEGEGAVWYQVRMANGTIGYVPNNVNGIAAIARVG